MPQSSVDALRDALCRHLRYALAAPCDHPSDAQMLQASALFARDRSVDALLDTEKRYADADAKRLYYLSMEFLMGRSLGSTLSNLGILDECAEAVKLLGIDLDEVRETEPDAALGNGGLGRLAACYLDSLATLGMPGFGYGINYEYGLFRQAIEGGEQKEYPDNWRENGTPWEISRPDESLVVLTYGDATYEPGPDGFVRPVWRNWKPIVGVPHDMPVVGYGGRTVNTLRLFTARPWQEFDMGVFNDGDYHRAVGQKIDTETISRVLYPSDIQAAGKELRLLQEYFLTACAIGDIVRRFRKSHDDWSVFPDKVALQMNDTHPALSVAELMRVLVDDNNLGWEQAWDITTKTCAYTNHTLLSEALERWPVPLFGKVLPRHLQIVLEINSRHLAQVQARFPGDTGRLVRLSLIEESEHGQQVRMAHLAIAGSHAVNGVSRLHTELIEKSLVPDFYALSPEKFLNVTNGITPRRWLLKANEGLAQLITDAIGDKWITDLEGLRELEPFAEDAAFAEKFRAVKHANKQKLAAFMGETMGITVDADSVFDVQIKRIHEYKRQLLAILRVMHEYLACAEDGRPPITPRTYLFAGKAAPGYWAAKQMIKLINGVADVVNTDPRVGGVIKVAFLPDYRVSLAEKIIPAADISEQISTAGKEASGTGNMKLSLNGALTVGTLDGANIEIRDAVGAENFFLFGLRADEIHEMQARGSYRPAEYAHDPEVARVLQSLRSDRFSPGVPGLFAWVADTLLGSDPYFHLADLPSYLQAQNAAGELYKEPQEWTRRAILNVARMGFFSSDRAVQEYADNIWNLKSV